MSELRGNWSGWWAEFNRLMSEMMIDPSMEDPRPGFWADWDALIQRGVTDERSGLQPGGDAREGRQIRSQVRLAEVHQGCSAPTCAMASAVRSV